MNPHPTRPLVLALVLATVPTGATTGVAGATSGPDCRVEPVSGLLVPERSSGVCLTEMGGAVRLAHRTRAGLLIVAPDTAPRIDGAEARAWILHLHHQATRTIWCPSDALDPTTGLPGADCLADLVAMSPGPAAFAGTPAVEGNLTVDAGGHARCPSALSVVGPVAGSDGRSTELRGMVVQFEGLSGCATAAERFEVATRASGAPRPEMPGAFERLGAAMSGERRVAFEEGMRRIGRLEPAQWDVVDRLVGLDDSSWELLVGLLSLDPSDLAGIAGGPTTASVDRSTSADAVVSPAALLDVINDILNRVRGLQAAVSNVQGVTTNIRSVLGADRPDIRELIDGLDLSRLKELVDNAREQIGGMLDVARELRNGIESFDPAAFRADLNLALDEVNGAWVNFQKLGCFDQPELTIGELRFPLIRRVIDKVPPVLLYMMSRMMDEFTPDWRTAIGQLNDGIPPDLLDGMCEGSASGAVVERAVVLRRSCDVLRDPDVEKKLRNRKFAAKLLSTLFEIISEFMPEDKTVGGVVNAVAGGGVTLSIDPKLKPTAKTFAILLDRLSVRFDNLRNMRDKCASEEAEIERSVRDCRPPRAVFLGALSPAPEPTFEHVADTVERWIGEAERAQLDVTAADESLAQARANAGTRAGFDALCDAYRELTFGGDQAGGRPPRRRS